MLLDYGLAPTDPPKYPLAPNIKDAVITRSHITTVWLPGFVLTIEQHYMEQI